MNHPGWESFGNKRPSNLRAGLARLKFRGVFVAFSSCFRGVFVPFVVLLWCFCGAFELFS